MKHRLRVVFDEETGDLQVTHSCTVTMGDQKVTKSEVITLESQDSFLDSLKEILKANRKTMERMTKESAVEHMAAVQGVMRRNRKQQAITGKMSPVGKEE